MNLATLDTWIWNMKKGSSQKNVHMKYEKNKFIFLGANMKYEAGISKNIEYWIWNVIPTSFVSDLLYSSHRHSSLSLGRSRTPLQKCMVLYGSMIMIDTHFWTARSLSCSKLKPLLWRKRFSHSDKFSSESGRDSMRLLL